MSFRHDQRGQAIQVGAVLLFAILIVAFSTYQAVIVPADNERVEFNHNQEVQEHLAELRGAIVGTTGATGVRSVTLPLGTQYPSRTLGLNPNSPSGSLRTVGTDDALVNLTIENAEATGEEPRDFWNGSAVTYNTGTLTYRPVYSQYEEAPTTNYEHSVLYNRFSNDESLVLANQTMLDGDRLSIVTINGSLDRTTSGSTTVDARPASSGGEPLSVRSADGDPITLRFSSRLTVDDWRERLGHGGNVTVSEGDFSPPGELNPVRVELERSSYRLQLAKAAVGQGATTEDAAYLTDRSGDGAPVPLDSSRELTLQVRDRYNNPVGGESVDASLSGGAPGTLSAVESTSEANGEVTFVYEVGENAPTGTYPVNFTLEAESALTDSFNRSTPANVTMEVTVGGASGSNASSGAYSVGWTNPDDESANDDETLFSCDPDACTWDVGASGDGELLLNARLDPAFEGIDLEFAVSNSTVAELNDGQGSTGPNGAATDTLTANANGTLNVLASGNDGSDTIEIEVVNAGGGPTGQVLQPVEVRDSTSNRLVFRIENTGSETVTVEEFSADMTAVQTNPNTVLDNGNAAEVEISRTSVQDGEANRNGTPYSFAVDGTYYDFVEDSNQGNTGASAIIAPEDDTVHVDLRQFQPGINELQLVDSASDADAQVTLRLSDGTVQEFYFEEA